jgi:hypothetical protein
MDLSDEDRESRIAERSTELWSNGPMQDLSR